MRDAIREFFWDNFIKKHVLFGKRWILLIPVIVVPALFGFVKQVFSLPDFRTTIADLYFLIPCIAVIILCFLAYMVVTNRSLPRDRYVIGVAEFWPVSEGAKEQALNTHDRVVEAINDRMSIIGIKGTVLRLRDTIDPRSENGRKRADVLGKHYQAHMVVCGTVRLDEEYYFKPMIVQRVTHAYRFSPRGETAASTDMSVPVKRSLSVKEQKVAELTDLATFVCGVARVNDFQYEEAEKILSKIEKPTAEAWFFRGFALLQLGSVEQSLSCFEHAYGEKPDFVFAWIYAGIALYKLCRDKEAVESFRQASLVNKEAPKDGIIEDQYIIATVLSDFNERLLKKMKEIRDTIDVETTKIMRAYQADISFLDGISRYQQGDYEGAVEAFEQSIELDPNDGNAWVHKSMALAILNQRDQAEQSLQKGLELNGKHHNLARAYAILGDRASMIAHLSDAIKEDSVVKILASVEKEFDPFRNDEQFKELIRN